MKHWKNHDVNFTRSSSVTELFRRCFYLIKNCIIIPRLPLIAQNSEVWMLFHRFYILCCISDIFIISYTSALVKMIYKRVSFFITSIRIWPNRDINIRTYSGTDDKWRNIVVMSSIWHKISFELYYSPDSTMKAVQKSPNARFADCPPTVRQLDPSIVPTCTAWISVAIE